MKRVNKLYYEIITIDNLISAFKRASKGREDKKEVINFKRHFEKNIMNLYYTLIKREYITGEFYKFIIHEPKKREISALPFVDRIIHHLYTHEFLIPYFDNSFIDTSYACIRGRGMHKASLQLTKYLKNYDNYYVIKMDISKYFASINKDILYNLIEDKCNDKYILSLTKEIIYSYHEYGIPIGNYPSQYYANIYLNELDKYIKHTLKIKHYLRYMDDFIIFTKNNDEAKRIYLLIETFLNRRLKLKLNKKSKIVEKPELINFCGYRHHKHYKLIRKDSKKRMLEKIYNFNNDYETAIKTYGKESIEKHFNFRDPVIAFKIWQGHIKHANAFNLYNSYKRKLLFYYEFLRIPNDKIWNLINYEELYKRSFKQLKKDISMPYYYKKYNTKQIITFKKNKSNINLLYNLKRDIKVQLKLNI